MARKSNISRNPLAAPKRTRSVITPQLSLNVLKDYHAGGMTLSKICERYSISYETCRKILDKSEYKPEDFAAFNPADVLKRRELDPLERLTLVKADATQTIELCLAFMRFKLEQEMRRTRLNEDHAATISARELTMFFAEAAPYVMTKADKDSTSGKPLQTERKRLYLMFLKDTDQTL